MRNDQLNCLHNTMLSRISINEVLTNFEKNPLPHHYQLLYFLVWLACHQTDCVLVTFSGKHLCIYTIYNVSSLYSSHEIEFTLFSRTEPENIQRKNK